MEMLDVKVIHTDSLISNISTAHSNIGYLLTLVLNLSVLLPMQSNQFSNNLALCLTNSCEENRLSVSIQSLTFFSERLGNPRHLVVPFPAKAPRT